MELWFTKHEEWDLAAAHKHCFRNRSELQESEICGCFYCEKMFAPSEIEEWTDDGDTTALCPKCGIDSVIGSSSGFPIVPAFLKAMNARFF